MFRAINTYLQIAVLLICPYACLGKASGSESPPESAGCRCCSHEQEQPSQESPATPADQDQDADCLCHGAIVDGKLRTSELDQATPLASGWLIDNLALSSAVPSSATISFERPRQFPPFSTGRDVRALTCVLLL
jgi:hypothetical protein